MTLEFKNQINIQPTEEGGGGGGTPKDNNNVAIKPFAINFTNFTIKMEEE